METMEEWSPESLLYAARAWADARCCVIPIRADGTKAPADGSWVRWQRQRPGSEQLAQWFARGGCGIAVVCGAVSGNLEMLELEASAVAERKVEEMGRLARDAGLAPVWERVAGGYAERSPSGGLHLLYRIDGEVAGNQRLARRPAQPRPVVLAETRGEGGYVIVAPSGGAVHGSGGAWRPLGASRPDRIPMLGASEAAGLRSLARALDEMPPPAPAPFRQPASAAGDGTLPGADFEERMDWADILVPAGWTLVSGRGGKRYWRRPGKSVGVSATTHWGDADILWVFSSSTAFEPDRSYSKFGAWAQLEHGGDLAAAARELSARGYGRSAPRPALRVADAPPPPPPPPATVVYEPPPERRYPRTDSGLAQRWADASLADMRWCPERKMWLAWDGIRWRWDLDETIAVRRAREVAEAMEAGDAAWYRRANSGVGIFTMVRLARSDPRLAVSLADLDADPMVLNTPGGWVDLRTGCLHPPDPALLCARITAVAPDPGRTPERWLEFLRETFNGDEGMISYVRTLLGLSLTGESEAVLPLCHGSSGANGKTTLLGTVMQTLGSGEEGYALTVPVELLVGRGEHPAVVAQLAGIRLAVASELSEGQRWNEGRVKVLTGGDQLRARFLYGQWFTFSPRHTLWLLSNEEPEVYAGGSAFWRRIRLVPFAHQVPRERQINGYKEMLVVEEGPAILAWLIGGVANYLAGGLEHPPVQVAAATGEYADSQNSVSAFVRACCVVGPPGRQDLRVRVSVLRAAYESWCREEGLNAVSPKRLTMILRDAHGVDSERSSASRWYSGVRLVDIPA